MANEYFDNSSPGERFIEGETARGTDVDSKLDGVETGFGKLPTEEQLKQGKVTLGTDTGAADAYAVDLPYSPGSYSDGLHVRFKVGNSNTGPSTINVNSLGVKTVVRQDGSPLKAGDLPQGYTVGLTYDGVNFRTDSPSINLLTDAETAATTATTQAGIATTKASEASTSASTSAASASAASNSETNASNSASAASASEGNASTSETNAGNSASAASTSETNAASSASSASTSASNASVFETYAANSASAASASETNAATSETNADLERQYAAEWANKAEDSLVSSAAGGDLVGDYSAKHFAAKAATSAALVDGYKIPYSARNCVLNQAAVSQGESTRTGMSSTKYTGNGTSQAVTTGTDMATVWGTGGEQFGGLVWIKERSSTSGNHLFDTIRGVGVRLYSEQTSADDPNIGTHLTSFDSNGFDVGSSGGVNSGTDTYVAWSFQTTNRTSGTTNRNKAYTSHYNPQLGFSITNHIGDATIGHEIPLHLPLTEDSEVLSIWKNRDAVTNWFVTSSILGNDDYLQLNLTDALATNIAGQSIYGTDTVSIGNTAQFNQLDDNIIGYHFTSIPGVSKVGKYVGTAATGNYVDCGFKVGWVMVKNLTTGSTNWVINDSIRGDAELLANTSAVEGSSDLFDFVDSGFTTKTTSNSTNATNDEYIFLAFAETSLDGTKSWADYPYPTTADTLTINEGTQISYANGFDANGPVDSLETVGAGVTYDLYSNLVLNGSFDTDTSNWTAINSATLDITSQRLRITNSAASRGGAYQTIAVTIGEEYTVTISKRGGNAGRISIGNTAQGNQYVIDTGLLNETYAYTFIATTALVSILVQNENAVGAENSIWDDVNLRPAYQVDATLYAYKDKDGSYGTTGFRPLSGLSRNTADEWGVESPLDPSLRTTAKHSDYESSTGVALASGEVATHLAWEAFNKDSNDLLSGDSFWTVANQISWLQYKFNEKRILKSWRLREYNSTAETPQRFTIEGSNDGLNWVTIDSSYSTANYTGNGVYLWGDLQDVSANKTPYLYHRINVTQTSGGTSTAISELEFNTILPSNYYNVQDGVMYEYQSVNDVTNGTFDTDTVWSKNPGVTIGSGVASFTSVGGGNGIKQSLPTQTIGRRYRLKLDVSNYSAGSIIILVRLNASGPSETIPLNNVSANGTYEFDYVATQENSYLEFVANGTTTLDIDNVELLADAPIERTYLAKIITDTEGNVASYENFPVSESRLQDAEVFGDLKVRGEIKNNGIVTAWVLVDETQSPPLIIASHNFDAVVDIGASNEYVVDPSIDLNSAVIPGEVTTPISPNRFSITTTGISRRCLIVVGGK